MKAIEVDGCIVIAMSKGEAENIGNRINCSSFTTFDQYRKDNNLGDLNRHPLAENLIEQLADCGVTVGGDEDDC